MQSAVIPDNEPERLAALQALEVLDTPPEPEFDALVQAAALVCSAPVSLISLVDAQRQWFKANLGLPGTTQTPRDVAFCAHAILDDALLHVPDAAQDPRFFDNPLVTAPPSIRFYAGAPIVLDNGQRVGTLCVINHQPQQLDARQQDILRGLARAAAQVLQCRRALRSETRISQDLRQTRALLARTSALAGVGGWELQLPEQRLSWTAETRRIHAVAPDYQPTLAEALAFYPPEVRDTLQAAVVQAMNGGPGFDLELPFVRATGERIWVRAMGSVAFEDGQPRRLTGVFQDITARRAQQVALQEALEKARQASLSKGQFLANMSHEIRTPMNAVLGMLKLLQLTPLSAEQLDYASKAQGAAQSMLALLNDILDYSKVEAGKMTLESEPFAISELLQDLSVVLSANVGDKDLALRFELDPALPAQLCGDALRLKQVLINLGGNAIKFTAAGQVLLALRCVAQTPQAVQVAFSVQDSGIGIAPDKLGQIFEGFAQAEASTTRRYGGSGLGLAISRRLVALMGGEVQVSSTLGVGSTFAFTLTLPRVAESVAPAASAASTASVAPAASGVPRASNAGVAPPTPAARVQSRRASPLPASARAAQPLKGLRILIVEDNLINQQVAKELLSRQGAEVTLANNGLEGVHAVTHAQPAFDVVLMDLQMPELDGYGATRAIRQQLGLTPEQLPIVAMTANALPSDRAACLAAGMNEHVGKPFDLAKLVALLQRLTHRPDPTAPA